MSEVDEEWLKEKRHDESYPSVVGLEDKPASFALDHVYMAIGDEIENDERREGLALIPSEFVRGIPTEEDARMILQRIEQEVYNEEILSHIEEARKYLDGNGG